MNKALDLSVYKTNVGMFVRNFWGGSYNNYTTTNHAFHLYRFNGDTIGDNASLRGGFFHLKGVMEITKVERLQTESVVFSHLELIEPSLQSDKIPLVLNCKHYWDSDNECYTTGDDDLDKIVSLYRRVMVNKPSEWIDIEFKVTVLGELNVSDYCDPVKMEVRTRDGGWNATVNTVDIANVTSWSEVERMLTPEFLIHERPCTIHSEQLFKIVRAYIKEYIDNGVACMNSDYDFVIEVSKKVRIKPWTRRQEILTARGNSYRPPKFKQVEVAMRTVPVFRTAPKKYQDAPVIEPIGAPNLRELAANLKRY